MVQKNLIMESPISMMEVLTQTWVVFIQEQY